MDTLTQRWNTLWGVQRSVRYHARRQSFFDLWRRWTSFMSLLLGSTAAAAVMGEIGHHVALSTAFAVAVLSAFDLVVGTAESARKHNDLRRRFVALESRILANEEPDASTVSEWCAERLAIESDEPPTYIALNMLCENEQAIATDTDRRYRLSVWQRATAHWMHWENLTPKQAPAAV